MPSLFHVAATLDDLPAPSKRKPLSSRLPADGWPFSRDRLERALHARMSEIRKNHASIEPKPTRRAANHPFEFADAAVKAA